MKGQARAWVEKGPIMADRTSGKTGGCGAEGALRFEFTLARRIVSNTAASPGHQIIGLCAEPGLGGSKFIEELKAGFAREKLPVRFRNFGAQEPERATRTLVRFSNGTVAEASAPRAVVFLEGLPPLRRGPRPAAGPRHKKGGGGLRSRRRGRPSRGRAAP